MSLEVNKCHVKVQYDKAVHPRKFSEGELVLLLDQAKEPLGAGKFNPIWHGPYVVKRALEKGTYELVDYEGIALVEPRNGLYLKNTMHDLQPGMIVVYYCTILHCIVRFSYGDRVC